MEQNELKYAGFWIRVVAALIDSVLIGIIIVPILIGIYGKEYFASQALMQGAWDFLLSWVFPAIAIVLFWMYRSATPGKTAVKAKIVDARTGGKPSSGQLVLRYFGYYVSIVPLMLGLVWVAFDARKQGWHDKIAKTIVIRYEGAAGSSVSESGE